MKKDTVEMLHKVYEKLEKQNEIELLAELKQFVKNVKHTECLLTRGGIIQDKNGKFCIDGDKVLTENCKEENKIGILSWRNNGFHVIGEAGEMINYYAYSSNIEKVE